MSGGPKTFLKFEAGSLPIVALMGQSTTSTGLALSFLAIASRAEHELSPFEDLLELASSAMILLFASERASYSFALRCGLPRLGLPAHGVDHRVNAPTDILNYTFCLQQGMQPLY